MEARDRVVGTSLEVQRDVSAAFCSQREVPVLTSGRDKVGPLARRRVSKISRGKVGYATTDHLGRFVAEGHSHATRRGDIGLIIVGNKEELVGLSRERDLLILQPGVEDACRRGARVLTWWGFLPRTLSLAPAGEQGMDRIGSHGPHPVMTWFECRRRTSVRLIDRLSAFSTLHELTRRAPKGSL